MSQQAQETVVVPVKPTRGMMDAAARVDWSNEDERASIINMWQSMIASAPVSPDSDLLKEAVGLLRDAVEELKHLRRYANDHGGMFDEEDWPEARAFLSKVEGRGA